MTISPAHLLEGRLADCGHRRQQRTLEPASVLIGSLEIEVSRERQTLVRCEVKVSQKMGCVDISEGGGQIVPEGVGCEWTSLRRLEAHLASAHDACPGRARVEPHVHRVLTLQSFLGSASRFFKKGNQVKVNLFVLARHRSQRFWE